MAPDSEARLARPGLSLYANLLDPSSDKDSTPGTISRAPVVFKQPAEGVPPQDGIPAEKQQMASGRYELASMCGRSNSAVWECSYFLALSCNIQLLYAFNRQKGHSYQRRERNPNHRLQNLRRQHLRLPCQMWFQPIQQASHHVLLRKLRSRIGQQRARTMMSTDSMVARKGYAVAGKSERRTRKNLVSNKIGTTFMIPPVQITMKITSTAMRGSWKSENGRIGSMRIAWQRDNAVIRIIRVMSTDLS